VDNARLVKRCLAGDENAWAALLDKYKALIYSIPIKYGLPPHDAADIFQIVCTELLEHLPGIREPRALPKWLIEVTHHACYRHKNQQARTLSRDTEPGLPEPVIPPVAESIVQQTQDEQSLRDAIAALSPQCARLVHALFFETPARPYAEIAAELGLAVGSIGFTRQKCVERLRRSLVNSGYQR
jgi:RNA polymerase sigma factor (sigma-70 family)